MGIFRKLAKSLKKEEPEVLDIPDYVNREDLESVLKGYIESGDISVEMFITSLDRIRGETSIEVQSALERDEKSTSGIRARNYRDQQFYIPDDVTREDMVKVLEYLVAQGIITAESIHNNREFTKSKIREVTVGVKTKDAIKEGKYLDTAARLELLDSLSVRFEKNMFRHENIKWLDVLAKLQAYPKKLWSLNEMERTGGEPDVIGYDSEADQFIFMDCSLEVPIDRRCVCYDKEGQERYLKLRSKKLIGQLHTEENEKRFPELNGNAVDMAKKMGIRLLTLNEYSSLQKMHKNMLDRDSGSYGVMPTETGKIDQKSDTSYEGYDGGIITNDRYNSSGKSDEGYTDNSIGFLLSTDKCQEKLGFRGSLRV